MELTEHTKNHIQSLSYEELLAYWRFDPAGNPWFRGETGDYWARRMEELRNKPGGREVHAEASTIGWGT